jgi:hypothetical protein
MKKINGSVLAIHAGIWTTAMLIPINGFWSGPDVIGNLTVTEQFRILKINVGFKNIVVQEQ